MHALHLLSFHIFNVILAILNTWHSHIYLKITFSVSTKTPAKISFDTVLNLQLNLESWHLYSRAAWGYLQQFWPFAGQGSGTSCVGSICS
jgi:hypothetical protein